jgi:isopentenyl-diphosphate delta-isomerase
MSRLETEEQYDVLDENGNKTGEVLPKSVVHERELRHASVFIWIYNNNSEILLQHRSKDKKSFPNVWDVSVAGHISAGDEPLETAVREIEEEVGLKVSPSELKQVDFTYDTPIWLPDKTHPEFCWVYILHREINLKDITIQQEELDAVKLETISSIQAKRKLPGSDKIFAARNPRIYDAPFKEIEKLIDRVSS